MRYYYLLLRRCFFMLSLSLPQGLLVIYCGLVYSGAKCSGVLCAVRASGAESSCGWFERFFERVSLYIIDEIREIRFPDVKAQRKGCKWPVVAPIHRTNWHTLQSPAQCIFIIYIVQKWQMNVCLFNAIRFYICNQLLFFFFFVLNSFSHCFLQHDILDVCIVADSNTAGHLQYSIFRLNSLPNRMGKTKKECPPNCGQMFGASCDDKLW